jgi:hypothetical protein
MEIKIYDHSDLRSTDYRDDKKYKFEFIADLLGDNPEIFEDCGDNHGVANKLKQLGAFGKGDSPDEEAACFYIYFRDKAAGVNFLKKLSAYIRQKKSLIETAKAF